MQHALQTPPVLSAHVHEPTSASKTTKHGQETRASLLAEHGDEGEEEHAHADAQNGKEGCNKTIKLIVRRDSHAKPLHRHRVSTVSLAPSLAESEAGRAPPPTYETAISSPAGPSSAAANSTPSSSSCDPSPRRRVRSRSSRPHSPSCRSFEAPATSDSDSDPTSDSDDPLNDLLRLTTSLLATSTSILASSTALHGNLSRLLTSDAARSPPRSVSPSFSSLAAAEDEGALPAELAEPDGPLDAALRRLDQDVQRFALRQRGPGQSGVSLLAASPRARAASGVDANTRAERGRTVYVTAEAEGGSPSLRRSGDTAGGMRRSPSAAAEMLGKLAASPTPSASPSRPGSGMRRSVSLGTAAWSTIIGSSSPSGEPAASGSRGTLDTPAAGLRRPSALSVALVEEDEDEPAPSALAAQLLPPPSPASRPSLRRSPSSRALPSLSSSPSASLSTSTSLSSLLATPTSEAVPAFPSSASPSTTPRKHRRTPAAAASISALPRNATAALSVALASGLDPFDAGEGAVDASAPTGASGTGASAARDRLKAFAGGTGGEVVGSGASSAGAPAQGSGSWWSWGG
ncbi:hypothetical protein JCM10207_000343 [Rhodosporidiobolus poonsookiae]